MTPEEARGFVADHHRAVLITRRRDGRLQTSPVTVGADDHGVVMSSRETAYKTRNIRRDPNVALCVFTDAFFGPWIQIDGRAELVPLPEAMEELVEYYRRIRGEHPDWDEYRRAMETDDRVLIKVTIVDVGPVREG
ncbi:MAG: PPOX class F420-dependent oxidoreductase [Actinomycetota bacterium]